MTRIMWLLGGLTVVSFWILVYYYESGGENTYQQVTTRETEPQSVEPEPLTPEQERKAVIQSRIDEGKYIFAELTSLVVNRNLGNEESTTYIALVYLDFNVRNTRNTGNELMRMYSDDIAAFTANQGVADIDQFVVFWKDEYNNRSLKYTYDYNPRAKGFFLDYALE